MSDDLKVDWGKPTPDEHAGGAYDPYCAECRSYAQPDMGNPTTDPIAKRMEALVRRMASDWTYMQDGRSFTAEARAIVALLPELVDADLVECRKVLADRYPDSAQRILAGHWDINAVADSLACVNHLRALERDSREG